MVGLEGQGSTSEERKKAPMEIKVCGGTLKVSGFVKNTPCEFVVDTGADVTILSSRVFGGRGVKMSTSHFERGCEGTNIYRNGNSY